MIFMNKYEEAHQWAVRTFPYYFKHANAHAWSFEGIMCDIQHALYNGTGLTRKDQNLEQRINSLPNDDRQRAWDELAKAEDLYARREKELKSRVSAELANEEAKSKKEAVSQYRAAWKKKGFFYKITHSKKKPSKLDFDSMNSYEINQEKNRLSR
jgi:hypothetical protein